MRVALVNYSFFPHLNTAVASTLAVLKQEGHDASLIDLAFRAPTDAHAHVLRELKHSNPGAVVIFAGAGSERLPTLLSDIRDNEGDLPVILERTDHPYAIPTCVETPFASLEGTWSLSGEIDRAVVMALRAIADGVPAQGIFVPPEDINSLPPPDYSLFDVGRYLRTSMTLEGHLPLFASRGCSFRCSFCRLNAWPYQQKAPPLVLEEIESLELQNSRKGFRSVGFYDPTFGLQRKRFQELMGMFIKEGIPRRLTWFCQTRPEIATREWANLAAKGGCQMVELGLECFSEKARFSHLQKEFTNAQFRQAVRNLSDAGISCDINIITGIPGVGIMGDLSSLAFAVTCKPFSLNISPYRLAENTSLGNAILKRKTPLLLASFRGSLARINYLFLKSGQLSRDLSTGLVRYGGSYIREAGLYLMNRGGRRGLPLNHPFTAANLTKRNLNNLRRRALLDARDTHRILLRGRENSPNTMRLTP